MNLFTRAAVLAATFGAIAACTVTSTTSGTSGGTSGSSGATSEQLSRCHGGCDKMKFFQCSSAAELSRCYSDCDSAQPKAIDVFIACADNSICDPACRTNITPAPTGSSSGGSGGGGASASSCQTACTKLITTCNLLPVGQMQPCLDACTKNGYQYQIDCVANTACGDIASRCGGSTTGGGSSGSTSGGTSSGGSSGSTSGGSGDGGAFDPGLSQCQTNCDFLHTRQCLTATEQSTCRSACASVTGAKRDTFNGCANGAADCPAAHDCFAVYTQ